MEWKATFDLRDLDGVARQHPSLLVTSDDLGEQFYDAWRRSWQDQVGRSWEDSLGYDPRESDSDWGFSWWVELDGERELVVSESRMTVDEMSRFLDGHSTPLRLAWGLGGDGQLPLIFETLGNIVNAGLTLTGIVGLARGGQETLDRRIFSRHRRLFADWRDSSIVSIELEQAVRAERDWTPAKFRRIFGASEDATSELLRSLNYEPRRDEWGDRYWRDRSS